MPVLFSYKEAFTLGLCFKDKAALFVEGHSIGSDVLVPQFQFHEVLLVDRIPYVKELVQDEHH